MISVFVLSGPDGVGKSTVIKALTRVLSARDGIMPRVTWRRSGFFFARFQNVIGRIFGISFYKDTPLGRLGYHRYSGSFGAVYIFLVWLDCKIFYGPIWALKDAIYRGKVDVVDRYYIDILADVMLSTNRTRLPIIVFDKLLKRKLSKHRVVVLACDLETVVARRPDISYDQDYSAKVRIYKLLRRFFRLPVIDTATSSPEQCAQKVLDS